MSKYKLVPVKPTTEMLVAYEKASIAPVGPISKNGYKAMLAAAPAVQVEPVAWIVRHPRFCGKFTDDKETAEYWESKEQGCTAPLFLHSQPAPAIVSKMVEALESLLEVQDEGCRYDHEGYCQSHNLDHVDDGCRVARAKTALATHRKGDQP